MITITLQQIKDQAPCADGWAKVLKSKGGTKADMSLSFPLTDVLASNGLADTLWCLRALPAHNALWRKYAVWCAQQVEHLMSDDRSREALVVAWRHSEGLAADEELAAAREAREAAGAARETAWKAAMAAWAAGAAGAAAGAAARDAARAAGAAAQSKQEAKLIEILAAGEWV